MTWTSVFLVLLLPALASAQPRDRELRVRVGDEVWISTAGERLTGRITAIASDQVTVAGDTTRTVLRGQITRIDVRDTPKEGALAGAAIAGALALSAGPLCVDSATSCSWVPNLIVTGLGAAIGALIDRPSPQKPSTVARELCH